MWFKVDDKLHDHRKARAAQKAAIGVWTLAGSWSADNATGGFVPASVLPRWGNARDAARLVEVGLWHPDEQDGEKGWTFHQWEERQPDAATVKAQRAAESEAGTLGNHRRWHVPRGIAVASCVHCNPSGPQSGPQSGDDRGGRIGGESSHPVPTRPDPTVVVQSVSDPRPARTIDDDGLDRIAKMTKGGKTHARKTAELILDRTNTVVRDPLAYVLAAVRDDPDAYRYRRGNPTKADECPTHPGQWADHCAGCAVDRRAAS